MSNKKMNGWLKLNKFKDTQVYKKYLNFRESDKFHLKNIINNWLIVHGETCLCPFCNEGEMKIHKRYYVCKKCSAQGDEVAFIMALKKTTLLDTVKMVCKKDYKYFMQS